MECCGVFDILAGYWRLDGGDLDQITIRITFQIWQPELNSETTPIGKAVVFRIHSIMTAHFGHLAMLNIKFISFLSVYTFTRHRVRLVSQFLA